MTDESDLTERQRDVLRLVREGKSPTEIGKELSISSQGVHGHMRRLREHGLIPALKPTARKPAAKPSAAPNERFDPAQSLRIVVGTITAQLDELDAREQAIDAEIAALNAEKQAIENARTELQKLVPEN
jgi:predicted transcriptional regulator